MPKEYQHKTIAGFFSAHRDRWIKGAYEKDKTIGGEGVACFCLIGKARDLYPPYEQDRVAKKLADAIKEIHPTTFKRLAKNQNLNDASTIVIDFNDTRGRTVDQIVEVAQHARV